MSIDKYINWNEIWQEEICLEIAKDCTENETHIDLIDRFLKLEDMQLLKDECSLDEDGNMVWKRIEAVTRHPVINKDGTNTMIRVTTKEHREVVATKAKSFLKLHRYNT